MPLAIGFHIDDLCCACTNISWAECEYVQKGVMATFLTSCFVCPMLRTIAIWEACMVNCCRLRTVVSMV